MPDNPIATYRIQLRPGFGFQETADILEYLSDLGISHVYTSPYLQAALDSTHGYDIVDPTKLNAQLGNEEAHAHLAEHIQKLNLNMMIDIVPNHMAILGKQNPWWWDVLENGPLSNFAPYFDIDWDYSEQRWKNKILLPVLSDHYGRVLENGELKLSLQEGNFILHYKEHSFPIDPSSLSSFFNIAAASCQSEMLSFLAESYAQLNKSHRHRDKAVLSNMFMKLCHEDPAAKFAIEAEITRLNSNVDALDALIEKQNYRLAFWRTVSGDLGYRRFFDIKDLIGLRMEKPEVFLKTHALPITWFSKGWVKAFRIDHPDGLYNPKEYFLRLSEACPGSWIIAEKILAPHEKLPADWPIAGTTGYDFLNLAQGLFIDPEGKEPLTKLYENTTGKTTSFNDLVYECKILVLSDLFGSEINRLTNLFLEICERHRRYRDYTRPELKEALSQTAACFPVYRSYVTSTITTQDQEVINQAINEAIKRNPDFDPELFHFFQEILSLRIKGPIEEELAMRFQQLTPSVMAKGFEDTALYRYNRLIALNEVGSDPNRFGNSLEQFHNACAEAHPLSLLASTTHDTKRSEDVRARLALLSEIPELFSQAIQRWITMNSFQDRNAEYLFYQTLIGAWPIDQDRILRYMEKAIKEAKEHTSWTKPHPDYENSLRTSIQNALQNTAFMDDLKAFAEKLIHPGRINSLAATLLKLTAPGIPDIYQGCELWNLTLVDPDNRSPVDFNHRKHLLNSLNLSPEEILQKMDEGLPKLYLIQKTLTLRKQRPDLFTTYTPLYAQGEKNKHVISFLRASTLITIVPRFPLRLNNNWENTTLDIPPGTWHNIFTNDTLNGGRPIPLPELLSRFPVALLTLQ